MENASPLSFSARLRQYRLIAGFSQEGLAERSGLSARAISDLERGARRVPYRETVRLLADALNLSAPERAILEDSVARGRGPRLAAPQSGGTRSPLPKPPLQLIGRDDDVIEVLRLLRQSDVRLLTLTGPPGIGKTSLALAVGTHLSAGFPDGVVFVGLAPIDDARLVGTSILQALGLVEAGREPVEQRLKTALRDKRVLMVLDNFEQVVDAAPVVGELLDACPGVVALVTSRAALRLRAEQAFPVVPLAIPERSPSASDASSIASMAAVPAVMLFVARARAVLPSFTLTNENAPAVGEICRRLDGLPLAIELAAARCTVLTPQALLTRLGRRLDVLTGGARDAPARQQTLRSAIAWSYDLLPRADRLLFRRLGVFVGGCSLAAAEHVCDPGADMLNGLTRLVDQSLVQQHPGVDAEPRFVLLETLRAFATEQLLAAGEYHQMQQRHARDVLALAEQAERYMYGGARGLWLHRLSEEQDNIRAALRYALEQDEPELGLRLVNALWLWLQRRLLIEGRGWAEQLLVHPGAQDATTARAGTCFTAGHFAWLQGDVRAMRTHLQEAVTIWRGLGYAAGLGRALPFLGLSIDDDHATARRLAEEGVTHCRSVGDSWGLAIGLTNLGRIEATWGQDPAASGPLSEATKLFRRLGDDWLLALPLTSLGAIAYRSGEYAAAHAAFAEALPCFQAVEDRRNTTQTMSNLGYVALAQGRIERARSTFTDSLAFGREHGDGFNVPACLRGLAAVALDDGNIQRAVRYLAAAAALTEATGIRRWPAERLGSPAFADAIRSRLQANGIGASGLESQSFDPEQIISEALDVRRERVTPLHRSSESSESPSGSR